MMEICILKYKIGMGEMKVLGKVIVSIRNFNVGYIALIDLNLDLPAYTEFILNNLPPSEVFNFAESLERLKYLSAVGETEFEVYNKVDEIIFAICNRYGLYKSQEGFE